MIHRLRGRVAMVHPAMPAMPAMGHAHVRHGQQRRLAETGHIGRHALARRQCGAREGRPAHAFGEDRVRLVFVRFDDDVVGLGDADTEFIDLDRFDLVPVRLQDRHLQARNTDVEIGHGRGVDEAKTHRLASLKETGPVLRWALAVDLRREALQVLDVGRHHAHLAPVGAVGQRRLQAEFAHIVDEVAERALLPIVVVRHHLEIAQDTVRRVRMRIVQDQDIVPVGVHPFAFLRRDDDRAERPFRLLQVRVAVIPVGAGLDDREGVGEGLARLDPVEADRRHAVLLIRQDQAMPVDRGVLVEIVGDVERHLFAFREPQHRPRRRAVEADPGAFEVAGVDFDPIDDDVIFPGGRLAGEDRGGQGRPDRDCVSFHWMWPSLIGP